MKTKLIFLFLIICFALTLFTISTCAFTPLTDGEPISEKYPTRDEVARMIEAFELQKQIGFIPGNYQIASISYDPEVRHCVILIAFDQTPTTSGNTFQYFDTTEPNLHYYAWTNMGWSNDAIGGTVNRAGVYRQHFYYSFTMTSGNTTYPHFVGYNPSSVFGNDELNSSNIVSYYRNMLNALNNYGEIESSLDDANEQISNLNGQIEELEKDLAEAESSISDAREEGYKNGYVIGQANCAVSHGGIRETGYTEGYNKAKDDCALTHDSIREEGWSEGLLAGLTECEANHPEMLATAYQEGNFAGYSKGYANGQADCVLTHEAMISESCQAAYSDGYMAGLHDGGGGASTEDLAAEYTRGYDKGYTDALETSDQVLNYVDGIFSAPLDFLYGAFNIEILGINLFNVIMLVISILLVGAIILFVLKFR